MMHLRDRIRHLHVRWRRWRLFRAYFRVAKRRTGCVSLVPYIAALQDMEQDGLLTVEDGDVSWFWPESGDRGGGDRGGGRTSADVNTSDHGRDHA